MGEVRAEGCDLVLCGLACAAGCIVEPTPVLDVIALNIGLGGSYA